MDLDNEIAKCDKKLGLARLNLTKLQKVESQPNYEETIPANVREANDEKVQPIIKTILKIFSHLFIQRKTYEAEIATLETSKEMFANLK